MHTKDISAISAKELDFALIFNPERLEIASREVIGSTAAETKFIGGHGDGDGEELTLNFWENRQCGLVFKERNWAEIELGPRGFYQGVKKGKVIL